MLLQLTIIFTRMKILKALIITALTVRNLKIATKAKPIHFYFVHRIIF